MLRPFVRSGAMLLGLSALVALPAVSWADVKLPAIFTDHMVLQQGQKNRVWGTATAGEKVTVSIGSQQQSATAGNDGKWMVSLEPLPVSSQPATLTVKGNNTVAIQDVLVGEVWICSGQSNMQWSVNQSTDADLERLTAKHPQIRFISVPQVGTQEPQSDFKGSWSVCSPDTVGDFSAVGYFFGRQLHETLGVPIGLIDDAWGGSACEAWIRRDILASKPEYAPLMERWAGIEKNAADPAVLAKYEADLAKYKKDAEEAKAAGKPAPRAPNHPAAILGGNARPGNIYNGVLKPTIGYGIRGAIWYQGESNASRAYQYRELFPLMIQSWRDEWQQGDFPFYYVQLADFMAEKTEPGDSAWAELREAQTMTMKKLPKTGQAVIIDIGEGKDIHPKNKLDVGKRLARWALANDYGVSVPYHSPEYAAMEKQGSKIVLKFDFAGSGFRPFDTAEARGFAIAGEDKKFVTAQGKVTGPNTIEVWSDSVTNPVAVRYAWADNPVCNVYSNDGLPLTPFRTDDWPGVTASAN
ncbi:MAG TPA: sialate O-acetylesterase [Planctomycetaceae bacterium]|nr:sialate O-acetylesterase [Planctomycetaceae bacterium]